MTSLGLNILGGGGGRGGRGGEVAMPPTPGSATGAVVVHLTLHLPLFLVECLSVFLFPVPAAALAFALNPASADWQSTYH